MQIRIRAPDGQSRLEIEDDATLDQLVKAISEKTGLGRFCLKYGYPLKNLDITTSDTLSSTIADLRLRGETVVLAPLEIGPPRQISAGGESAGGPRPEERFVPKRVEPDETVLEWPERGGFMLLRVMPDDNSCMFTAVGGALGIADPSRTLRDKVAVYILARPDEYSEVVLNDQPERYARRIRQSDTWGGAIELSILSDIYDIQISSIDVKFGENKDQRCIILYSGIHYDRIVFAMDLSYPAEVDVTKWATDDDDALEHGRALAQKLQRVHYFTDTTDFVIKCEICDWIGQGTKDAAKHESATGHRAFGEMQIE